MNGSTLPALAEGIELQLPNRNSNIFGCLADIFSFGTSIGSGRGLNDFLSSESVARYIYHKKFLCVASE
jgi:hypothetical protein